MKQQLIQWIAQAEWPTLLGILYLLFAIVVTAYQMGLSNGLDEAEQVNSHFIKSERDAK